MSHFHRCARPFACATALAVLVLWTACAKPPHYQEPDPERADGATTSKDTGVNQPIGPGATTDASGVEADGADSPNLADGGAASLSPDANAGDSQSCSESSCNPEGPATCKGRTDLDGGSSCSSGDSPVRCGNGVVELGETCDPIAQCSQRLDECKSDRDNLRIPVGQPETCNVTCSQSKRACGPSDGQCPSSCGTSSADPDCKVATGGKCQQSAQCQSNNCVDGVCCESGCDGLCQACANSATGQEDGKCAPVRPGADPRNACAATDVSACGNDGSCDGRGACRKHVSGAVCGPTRCSDDGRGVVGERRCDGQGTCAAGSTTTCAAGEQCQGSRCVSTCGLKGQACCELQACKGGLTCLTNQGKAPYCDTCGGVNEACCEGPQACAQGGCFATPAGPRCAECGRRGQFCCQPGDTCTEGTCMGVTVRQCL